MNTASTLAPPSTGLAFSVSAFDMKEGLKALAPAIANRGGALPVLSGVRIEGIAGGRVRMVGTDLQLTIGVDLPTATLDRPGVVVIPPKLIAGMVATATAKKDSRLAVSGDGIGEVELKVGNRRRQLRTLPSDEFPRLASGDYLGSGVIDTALLADVLPAASADGARPILTGVLIADERIVATDSYRLYITDAPAYSEEPLLIPSSSIKQVVKFGGTPNMLWKDREVRFAWDDERATTVDSRLIEGEFPNYKGLIPVSSPCRATMDRVELLTALKAIKQFPRELNTPMRFCWDAEGVVTVKVVVQDVGTDEHEIACRFEGPAIGQVAYNPDYLLAAIEGLEGDEVALQFTDAQKPGLFREPTANGERIRLLMPVRVS